jgi:hypothetical protein
MFRWMHAIHDKVGDANMGVGCREADWGKGNRGGLVHATVHPVAVEDVRDGLDVATKMAGEAEHAKQEEEIQELQVDQMIGQRGDRSVSEAMRMIVKQPQAQAFCLLNVCPHLSMNVSEDLARR